MPQRLAFVFAGICVLAAGCGSNGSSGTSATATTSITASAVAEGTLDGLLLSASDLAAAVGITGLTPIPGDNKSLSSLDVTGESVSPAQCIPIASAYVDSVYAGSGWTAVRNQFFSDTPFPGPATPSTHQVAEGVVLFPSANQAAAFFATSSQNWPACANRSYDAGAKGDSQASPWTTGSVSNSKNVLSIAATQDGTDGWTQQRTLTVRNNVVIDVMFASYQPTTDGATAIANQIGAKVPT